MGNAHDLDDYWGFMPVWIVVADDSLTNGHESVRVVKWLVFDVAGSEPASFSEHVSL
ncbi:hypothetical protein H1R20_g2927, partial [Candolleomyces eurysporus]